MQVVSLLSFLHTSAADADATSQPMLRMLLCASCLTATSALRAPALRMQAPSSNSADGSYPWKFNGRLWFRPALVKAPDSTALPDGVTCLSLGGYTVGGSIALQCALQ